MSNLEEHATLPAGGGHSRCPWHATYDPLAPHELSDPTVTMAKARHESPVFYSDRMGVWAVANRADILAVLRDKKNFSARKAMPFPDVADIVRGRLPKLDGRPVYPSALTPLVKDDPAHRPARALLQAPFTPKRVLERAPRIRAIAAKLLAAHEDGPFDFIGEYTMQLALRVIGDIVGIPDHDLPFIERSIDAVFQLNGLGLREQGAVEAAALAVADYWEYIYSLAEDRCANPVDDFTSVMARTRMPDGELPSPRDLAESIHSIISPGFETSAQAMNWGMLSLLTHRDQWELLKSDRSLIESAITEMLRYRTVLKRAFRVTTNDVEVGGVRIPKDNVVTLLFPSANRDEAHYTDPDVFDIRRVEDNLAFGRFQHTCVGAPMARLEMKVTLELFLDKYPQARIPQQDFTFRADARIQALTGCQIDLRAGEGAAS
ncbi:cytochrome P450 [Nocardia jiangxiensis]|uniref:Cytochrome P450 n=1 Tax=Nocardia jiangxiensis TaxID=282685 RepID=A0ABW6RZ17_9NOCA